VLPRILFGKLDRLCIYTRFDEQRSYRALGQAQAQATAVTQGIEQLEQEDMVERTAVTTVAWPLASNRECVVARPHALGRVLSRGGLAGPCAHRRLPIFTDKLNAVG
jgi:hypothetical protein